MSTGAEFETEHYRVMSRMFKREQQYFVVRKSDSVEIYPVYDESKSARDYALRLEKYLPLYSDKD